MSNKTNYKVETLYLRLVLWIISILALGINHNATAKLISKVNTAPTFISTPVISLNEGESYSYTIIVKGVDVADVTAPVLPDWLSMSATTEVTTIAGSGGDGFADGNGTSAQFKSPYAIAVGDDGNVYVSDFSNQRIRKITPNGDVTTLAGTGQFGFTDGPSNTAQFKNPAGIAVDASNNVYVADRENHRIRKIAPDGIVSTFAGSGSQGSADGTLTVAEFNRPHGIAIDDNGNFYIVDRNHRVRKITPGGLVSTLAGSEKGFADGTGTAAQFDSPYGITVDADGNIYVSDLNNHRIRKVTPSGDVSTLAGSGVQGNSDGVAGTAQFNFPEGLTIGVDGNIYVADRQNNRIRKITSDGVVSTLIGSSSGFADGIGSALFNKPYGVAADDLGNIYVADQSNRRVRKVSITLKLTGNTTDQVGTHDVTLEVNDGNGGTVQQNFTITVVNTAPTFTSTPVTSVREGDHYTYTIATDDVDGDVVEVATAAGAPGWLNMLTPRNVSTLAGSGTQGATDGTGSAAEFNFPSSVASDGMGNIFIADRSNQKIRKVTLDGKVTTLAGSGVAGFADGSGSSAHFNLALGGVAADNAGNVYVADGGNHRIRKITPNGDVSTLAGTGVSGLADGAGSTAKFNSPQGIAVDGSGNVYVGGGSIRIRKITPDGVVSTLAGSSLGFADGVGSAAQFRGLSGLATDNAGNVYVADNGNHSIRKVTPAGEVTTLAGSGSSGFADGNGTTAQFNGPKGVSVDGSGNVYVADELNQRVRKITPDGEVTTLAGIGSHGFADGSRALFNSPIDVAVDRGGHVYVADVNNHRIRKINTAFELIGNTSGNTGTHNVTLEANDGHNTTQQTFTVAVANQQPVITFADIPKTFGDADFDLEATSDSNGEITYSIIGEANGTSLSGTNNQTVTLGDVGDVTIRATQAADGIYFAATKDITLSITLVLDAQLDLAPATQTVCKTTEANVTLTKSQLGVNYYLKDPDQNVIDGPVNGTGGDLILKSNNTTLPGEYTITARLNTFDAGGSTSGTAVEMDGDDDHIDAGDLTALNSATAFTVEGWFTQSILNEKRALWHKSNDANVNVRARTWTDGRLYTYVEPSDNNYSSFVYTDHVNADEWFHYAAVYDGTQTGNENRLRVYINGEEIAQDYVGTIPAQGPDLSGQSLYIGKSSFDDGNWNGKIDEFKVWNKALSTDEVKRSMDGKFCQLANASGLVLYYDMEDGTGSSVTTDLSGSGINGTIVNADINTIWQDGFGCDTNSGMVSIAINDLPDVKVNGGNIRSACQGTSITLSGSGATSYTWDNGVEDNVAFTVTETTIYTVTGTGDNGCKNTAAVEVRVSALPVVNAGEDQTICAGNSVTLTATGASTYDWGGRTGSVVTFTLNATITYTVTGRATNGCTNTDDVVITVNDLPAVSGGADMAVCKGNEVTLTGSGANTYIWDNGVVDNVAFTPTITTTYTVTGTDDNGCTNTSVVEVTVNELPEVSGGENQTICKGNEITLSGTGAHTYTWDNGITDNVPFTPTENTTYTVTGTDLNGCQNTSTVKITINDLPLPTVSGGDDQMVCLGSPVTLSGTGAITYVWDNDVVDNAAFTPTATTTYTVTGTDENGCKNTDSVVITVNELPTVSGGEDQTVCVGSGVTLTGAGANSYVWDNGVEDNVTFNPTSTATYTVTGTDGNGCINTSTVLVTVNDLPVVSGGANQAVCTGSEVILSGSGANTYDWDNNVVDNIAFTPTITTVYTVTGTDLNGCKNTHSVEVTVNDLPIVSGGEDQMVCAGSDITLSGTGANTYVWDNGVLDHVAFTPTETNTYTVIGTDINSCENTHTVEVTVNDLPTVSGGEDQMVCAGSEVTLSGSGANTYVWDNGVEDNVAFISTATTIYTVTGTDLNGCENTQTVEVTVNDLPSVNAGEDQTICVGTEITLTATGEAQSFVWDNGVEDNVPFTPTVTTTYKLTGTDHNGCENTDEVVITVNELPNNMVTISESTLTAEEEGASYQWINCVDNGEIPGETGKTFTASESGSYAVRLTKNDCVAISDCMEVTVTVTSIQNGDLENSLSIYPNPTSNELHVNTKEKRALIMDVTGKLVEKEIVNGVIDVRDLQIGTYIIKLSQQQSVRFIKR